MRRCAAASNATAVRTAREDAHGDRPDGARRRRRGMKRALQCVEYRPCNARTQPYEHNLARRAGDRVREERVWPHPHRRDMYVNLKEACPNPKR
eukprot:6357519-Prymnesium_polylepis.1